MEKTKNQAAFIPAKGQRLEVRDTVYPKPGSNDIVIKNAAVAINPIDWKVQDYGVFIEKYPSVFGVDVAGVVEEVGSDVTAFAPGDRVIANPSSLSIGVKYATFQRYVLSPANVACKIPDNMPFEAAVVVPLAIDTSGFGLFKKGYLELPKPSIDVKPSGMWMVLYGGSTSVGMAAIQLATAAGVSVLAVAGKKSHALCRELGAKATIDYKDSNWIDSAADELRGKHVIGGYDSVGTEPTTKALSQVFQKAGFDVPIASTGTIPDGIRGAMVLGTDVTKDPELASALWTDFLPKALANGSFVQKPEYQVVGNGLEDIQKGMDMQKKGVSAVKLVVTIS